MALLGAARSILRRSARTPAKVEQCLPRQGLAQAKHVRIFSAAAGPAGKEAAKAADVPALEEISLGRFTADKDDIVLSTFKQFQAAYRGLLEGLKDIPLPLKGDDAAVKKFAQKVEALKRKVKYPDGEVLAQATLKWKARCARGDPRRFLASAVEGMEFSKHGQEVIDRLNLAMDEVEKVAGPPTAANKKAAEMLKKKFKVIKDEFKLGRVSKEAAKLEMYKTQLRKLREKVEEDIEVVKRREGLEWVSVDPASLRLRW